MDDVVQSVAERAPAHAVPHGDDIGLIHTADVPEVSAGENPSELVNRQGVSFEEVERQTGAPILPPD